MAVLSPCLRWSVLNRLASCKILLLQHLLEKHLPVFGIKRLEGFPAHDRPHHHGEVFVENLAHLIDVSVRLKELAKRHPFGLGKGLKLFGGHVVFGHLHEFFSVGWEGQHVPERRRVYRGKMPSG